MGDIGYDVIKILLGSLIPVSLGVVLYKPITRRCEARRADRIKRAEIEAKRDATLHRVDEALQKIQDDQKRTGTLLEQSIRNHISEMCTLEITLVAIQGYKLNGNVDDALKAVKEQKDEFMRQLAKTSCDGIGEGVD